MGYWPSLTLMCVECSFLSMIVIVMSRYRLSDVALTHLQGYVHNYEGTIATPIKPGRKTHCEQCLLVLPWRARLRPVPVAEAEESLERKTFAS